MQMRNVTPILSLIAVCLAGIGAADAGKTEKVSDPLPSGEKVLDRYIEVTGGEAAYRKIHNRQATGTLSFPGMGIEGPFSFYQTEPDRSYLEARIEGMGTIRSGTIDGMAWEQSVVTGPRLLEGNERAAALRAGAFNAELEWRKHYPKAECTGTEQIGDRAAYKVVLTPETGKPVTAYYDRDSGLLLKLDLVIESQMGEVATEALYDGYKRVDGILFPHGARQRMLSMEQVMTFDSIEHNVGLPADRYDPPEDVKALLAKAAASSAPAVEE